jgi:multiple sugar transport system permease protein
MKIPRELRELFGSVPGLLAFAVTSILLQASLYPLIIMVRTAFMSVGDPIEGTPAEIILAEANDSGMTLQNLPMMAGMWDDERGFARDDSTWNYREYNRPKTNPDDVVAGFEANRNGAAFHFTWEGDLRRFSRFEIEASEGDRWSIAWHNINGDIAIQQVESITGPMWVVPDLNISVSLPVDRRGQPFDPVQITGFTLIPRSQSEHWFRVTLYPRLFTFANFLDVWRGDNFSRYTFNSLLVAICVTLGSVITSLLAGYAFARSEWKFRGAFWAIMLGSMLIPSQVLLIPAFLILQHFPLFGGNDLFGQGGIGMLDSYSGLILPNLVMPLGIFLVRQSLLSLPDALEEAAVMDGASILQLLRYIVAPMLRPILATIALLAFLFNWNSFIFPLILIQTPEMRTLPVGLALFSARMEVDWVHLMAASTITALPIFIMFLFFQRQLIAGFVHEGVKG